ncbi:MAG: protein translocase subunit SecF [Treponema sp.]|nr:protein translocase subunit SecF [Treponema sp.]
MKKIIRFSKYFILAAIISCILVAFSVSGYIINNGFALGVDFQAGHIMEVQIAPVAFNLRWHGASNAVIYPFSNRVEIVVSGSGIEGRTHLFPFSEYTTIGSLVRAMQQLEGLEITVSASENIDTRWLQFSSMGNDSELGSDKLFVVHHVPQNNPVDISDIRNAMAGFSLGGVSVQNLRTPEGRNFIIRVEDREEETDINNQLVRMQVIQTLERSFDRGSIAVLRFDYVGSRFSKDLTDQAGILIFLTLLIILIYCTIRFKMQYAVGAVVAIIYDGLVMIAFMVWTRMEFTTLSIAALLTILGYSTNNTIIFFDRVRENLRLNPDSSFKDIIDISLTGILGRTIITTASTMLAVLALFIFTTGSMKDFALALLVGMVSGVYTTLFIVSGFVSFWENQKIKREKKKKPVVA